MSQRRSNRSQAQDEEELPEIEEAVKECSRFFLSRQGSKIPIKRLDIVNHLFNVCQWQGKYITSVLRGAQNTLKKNFGYKLEELKLKNGVHYLLVLSQECESLPSSVTDMNDRRVLMAALTHIFMTGTVVKEEEMWKFLEEAGVLEENDNAGRKILTTTFTKQLYLTHTKVGEGDLARYVFGWGQRAEIEVPKMFILEKMAKAFDKEPSHWCEQFREASE